MLDRLPEMVPQFVKDMTDAELRTAINAYCDSTIPRRAKKKRWKVKKPDVIRRAIYDNVFGQPWEGAVNPPAIRNMTPSQMRLVVTLCHSVLEGDIKLDLLVTRSAAMRA